MDPCIYVELSKDHDNKQSIFYDSLDSMLIMTFFKQQNPPKYIFSNIVKSNLTSTFLKDPSHCMVLWCVCYFFLGGKTIIGIKG